MSYFLNGKHIPEKKIFEEVGVIRNNASVLHLASLLSISEKYLKCFQPSFIKFKQ